LLRVAQGLSDDLEDLEADWCFPLVETAMTDKAPLAPALVNEFVGSAHGDFDRVRELLGRQSALVNAAWDWGNGDWETGLGAAAHVGRRDIALHLMANGARMDIFAAAMLGYLPLVRATLEAVPDAKNWRGPHGIALLAHAEAGGPPAASVVEYLRMQSCV
jgi:hypothetical protein